MYLITIDADVSGGKKGINVDTGAGEQRDVGGEERDVGAGEQRDVGGGFESGNSLFAYARVRLRTTSLPHTFA